MSTAPPTDTAPSSAAAPDPAPTPPDLPSLASRISELESQLAAARNSLTQSERRREVYRQLVEHGATEIDTASALLMERLSALVPDAALDIADEIRTLKRRKPALFKPQRSPSSMGGRVVDTPASPLDIAAQAAAQGGRAALLRYLRARRS